MKISFLLALLAARLCAATAQAEAPALLREAVDRWAGERDRWAFTQHVREFDGEKVEQERFEQYDPSKPFGERWTLVTIDGRPPTAKEWESWDKRKNKKKRREPKPIQDYFDLEHAQIAADSARTIEYTFPLQGKANWLFPIDKVRLTLTVNKETHAIERADATISEPFKVALGLARILDLDLDLQMFPDDEGSKPAEARPDGQMRAVVKKLGQRVEYVWTDFERVAPPKSLAKEDRRPGARR